MKSLKKKIYLGAEKPCHYPNETCINGCKTGYCAPTCENARPDCLQVDCTTAEPFCICSEGYIIGPEGNCIQKGECPPIVSECSILIFFNLYFSKILKTFI